MSQKIIFFVKSMASLFQNDAKVAYKTEIGQRYILSKLHITFFCRIFNENDILSVSILKSIKNITLIFSS